MQKSVLITGCSSGIGLESALELKRQGFRVLAACRKPDDVERMNGLGFTGVLLDMDSPESVERAADEVIALTDNRLYGLFNNAGYGVPGRYLSADWKTHADSLQVMLHAVCELTHRFLPAMEAAGHGRIVNVASLAGLVPASAGHTLYGATKGFLIRFSECLALETAPKGVHVTALCPGFTYTEFHDVNGMRARVSKLPTWLWLDADAVARQGLDAVDLRDFLPRV